jgi:hypothetical protein
MKKIKYIFLEGSIEGLTQEISLEAYNYLLAKRCVLKWMVTNKLDKHPAEHKDGVEGVYIDCNKVV